MSIYKLGIIDGYEGNRYAWASGDNDAARDYAVGYALGVQRKRWGIPIWGTR